LIQALREIGKDNVTRAATGTPEAHPAGQTAAGTHQGPQIKLAPAWMHPIFRELAEEDA
jgi:hypothetical protein